MKLSTGIAKLTGGNCKVFSMVGGLALAGAALLAGAPAAQAQVGFGVQFSGPRYVAPAPPPPVYREYGPAFYAPRPGFEARAYWDHRRAEEWRAHEEWVRRHEFYGRPAPYRGYPY